MIKGEAERFFNALKIPIYLTAVLWIVHIIKITSSYKFYSFGIYPRALDGLKGVFFSPLLHGDFIHLISNTAPLIVLTLMLFYFFPRVAPVAFGSIYLLSGFFVWLFARPVYHIGASGVIYGLVAFVFWSGVFRRNPKTIILALLVLVVYGGMFAGIVPDKEGVSWESHLIGGIVGLVMAFFMKSAIEKDEEERPDPWAHEALMPRKYYFPRDVFEHTKEERKLIEYQEIVYHISDAKLKE